MVEMPVVLRLTIGRLSHSHHVDHLNAFILGCVFHHGIQDQGGLTGGVGNHHPVTGPDALDRHRVRKFMRDNTETIDFEEGASYPALRFI